MTESTRSSQHIRRPEEKLILDEVARVSADGRSRAVLLYGPGGSGKTSLVRQLADAGTGDTSTVWVEPIDADDSDYWILSNLERTVAARLDPRNQFFAPFQEHLSRLPAFTRSGLGHETILSYLGRIKQIFVDCYSHFVRESGKTIVITFDTVETIRGTYLLLTLTQWMKTLPGTLFVLAGRPMPTDGEATDPIARELDDPYQPLPVTTLRLGAFTERTALDYLDSSQVAAGLSSIEKLKLVRLTRGSPLWLAFAVAHLDARGMPEEAEVEFEVIDRTVPYRADPTPEGQRRLGDFRSRLAAPYRATDFWHEAEKRLAVVRQGVNRQIWQRLVDDLPLPDGVADLDEAWRLLLERPWIRSRANGRYVTLHDAVAEELAQRVIPLHDQDEQWRRTHWVRAVTVYGEQIEGPEADLIDGMARLDGKLLAVETGTDHAGEDESELVAEAAQLDSRKREIDRFKAARLYYRLLHDFDEGCREFLELFGRAKQEHDVLLQDLLAQEMQRFLPGGAHPYVFDDAVGKVISAFREWLSRHPDLYIRIGVSLGEYLVDNEQSAAAIELLGRLPRDDSDVRQQFRISILLGNAYMRTPGSVRSGLEHFRRALALAGSENDLMERQKLLAEAHKELGYYYRNNGLWGDADESYQQARNAISAILSVRSSDGDREEMASIQTNWAYVKGLGGYYRDGANLVESAIYVRQRLGRRQEEGISWSVYGEVFRYERRFEKAWDAYAEAERLFQEQRNWYWLGHIYQEQAICLFQATRDGIRLPIAGDPATEAKRLITLALGICRDAAVRAYPSALNRAGRIFGQDDVDTGLRYLAEGVSQAWRLSDGWFWFANLVEHAELSFRAWVATGRDEYRDRIVQQEANIGQAMSEYEFPDLRGRWHVLRGHLAVHHWNATKDPAMLADALKNYRDGFVLIAQGGHVGSSGTSVIPGEFRTFRELFGKLPADVREDWQAELRRSWSALDEGSTLLLARLEELY